MGGSGYDLKRFLGPRPGQVYVYARVNDDTREAGTTMVVAGVAERAPGEIVVRTECAMPRATARVSSALESVLRLDPRGLVQTSPDGDVLVLPATLLPGTTWTRPVCGYSAELGSWRVDMTCRIAMIESVPVFGETRLTVRVIGRARVPQGEVVLAEQHAAGIGLVLRREQTSDFGASETVLEEIREEPPG